MNDNSYMFILIKYELSFMMNIKDEWLDEILITK